MNRLRKIIGNTVISLFGQGVTWSSTLILTIAYGRFLGDVKFGELYFAITFVSLIGFPIEFGFNQQLTRDVAQEPSKALRYLSNILCIKIVLWLIFYSGTLLVCRMLGYSVEIQMLVVICGITLLSGSLGNTISSLHYAFERVSYPVVGTILEKGLSALIGVIALRLGAGVQVMAMILLGGSLLSLLWQTIWVVYLVGVPVSFNLALIRELMRKSIPFIVYGVLGVIYYRVDTVILSLMASAAVVGWYGAGYRLFDTLVFLPSLVIGAIMYPIFSKLSTHSETDLRIAVEKSMNFLLFCGIPIAVGLVVAAPNIIGFLYHRAEFDPAIPVLQLLAPGLVFLYINSALGSVIISIKREKSITVLAGVALVFNVGLNLVMIRIYQQRGAAAVTSLTELLLLCLTVAIIPRSLLPWGSVKVGLKALAAAMVMAVAIWFTRQKDIYVLLLAAAVVYFAAAALFGTIPRDDLKALYGSIRNRKGLATENIPVVESADIPAGEATFLVDEEMQPELESAFTFRLELTDPVLPAYGHDLSLAPEPDKEAPALEAVHAIDKAEFEETGKRSAMHRIRLLHTDTAPPEEVYKD